MKNFSTPGVYINEIDKSQTADPAGFGNGAIVIKSPKGKVYEKVLCTSKDQFIKNFGTPTYDNNTDIPDYGYGMYSAIEFLNAGDRLNVVRVPSVGDKYSQLDFNIDDSFNITKTEFAIDAETKPNKEPNWDNTSTGSFLKIASKSPSKDANNTAISIELFHKDCDWVYSYDDEENIQNLIDKINQGDYEGTVSADDKEFLEEFKSPFIMKVSVYRKNDKQKFPTTINSNVIEPAEVFYVSLRNIINNNSKSLKIDEVINEESDFVQVIGFNDTQLIYEEIAGQSTNGTFYFTEDGTFSDQFVFVDSNYEQSETGLVALVRPIDDTAHFNDVDAYSVTEIDFVQVTLTDPSGVNITGFIGKDYDNGGKYVLLDSVTQGAFNLLDVSSYESVELTLYDNYNTNFYFQFKAVIEENVGGSIQTETIINLTNDNNSDKVIKLPYEETTARIGNPTDLNHMEQSFKMINGESEISSDIGNVKGWSMLTNKDEFNFDLLLVPTFNNNVKQYVARTVVNKRKDCTMLTITGERNDTNISEIVDSENYGYKSSSYVASYGQYSKVFDPFTSKSWWMPSMLFMASNIINEDNVWNAPMGVGTPIPGSELNTVLSDTDIGIGYDKNINLIKDIPGTGFTVWGQKTMYAQKSALSRLNVRLTLNFIKKTVRNTLFPYVGNITGTQTNMDRIVDTISKFLNNLKSQGGLVDFEVIIPQENLSSYINNNTLPLDIYLQPVQTIEFFDVNTVISAAGVDFNEIRVR